MKEPFVSAIITTKNSGRTIYQLLKSLENQSFKNIEIILVDNKSSDDTLKIAKTFKLKFYDFGPERSAQRNFGARKSSGRFLLFLDSDMVLSKNVVKECIEYITNNQKIGAVIIPEKSFGKGFWTKTKIFERQINAGEEYFEAARFFHKSIFDKFKGYDETLTGPEDWELPQRISKKYQIGRVTSIISHNEGKHTLISLARRKYYYGLSAHKYLRKQKMGIFNPRTVYFLRSAYYRKWYKLIVHPVLTMGLFIMLTTEMIAGGLGYLRGRFKR